MMVNESLDGGGRDLLDGFCSKRGNLNSANVFGGM